MKVCELIADLQKMDPELQVIVYGSSGIESDVTDVEEIVLWGEDRFCLINDVSWPAT